MHLPIAVYLALRAFNTRCSWVQRFFLLGNVVVTFVNLLLTLQRSSYIVAALILVFLLLLFRKQRFYSKGLIAFVVLCGIAAIVAVGNIAEGAVLGRIGQLWQVLTTGNLDLDYAIWGRMMVQRAAIYFFFSSPIFGIGHGNFQEYSGQLVLEISGTSSAENSYLHMLAENGLVYLTAYLLWYGYWLRWNRRRANPQDKIHSILAMSVWAGLLLSLTSWLEADSWFLLYTGLMVSHRVPPSIGKTNSQPSG